jgi:hypothetical protein
MQLTRKRAIEMVLDAFERAEWGMSIEEQAKLGINIGIVLGLRMAATYVNKHTNYSGFDLRLDAARRLKKLEKAQ